MNTLTCAPSPALAARRPGATRLNTSFAPAPTPPVLSSVVLSETNEVFGTSRTVDLISAVFGLSLEEAERLLRHRTDPISD